MQAVHDWGRMLVEIRGHNLPGSTFCAEGVEYANVWVAVQERKDPVGRVRGDASAATWRVEVRVEVGDDGALDFKGPGVHGKRGDRFLYLTWGNVGDDGGFEMFRRAKLMLNRVDSDLVHLAERSGAPLVATVDLTDGRGGPRCARVDPPALVWSVR
jgi:Family of unknown function (DUF5990)